VPNRIIRDVGLTSRKLAAVSDWGERLYWRLYQAVDDFGRFYADPSIILARCCPLMLDHKTVADVKTGRDLLASVGLIVLYEVAGEAYLQVTKFDQRTRAGKSKFPPPDDGQMTVRRQSSAAVVVDVVVDEGGGVVGEPPPPAPLRARSGLTPTDLPAAVESLPPPAYEPPPLVAECQDCLDLLRMLADGGVYFASPGPALLARVHAAHSGCGMDLAKSAVRKQLDTLRGGMRRCLSPRVLFDPEKWEVSVNAVKGAPRLVVERI